MANYNRYGNAGDEEIIELNKINAEVLANPDEFENWEKLIRTADSLEGGLSRNSSPQSIQAARDVYDRFLGRYPLFYGYWKKYADLEFTIAGSESADYIYERAVACVPVSTDLWVSYCQFKIETCHDVELKRELFERAADACGLDYLSQPFWDKYLDFEKSNNDDHRMFAILSRIIHYPLHAYAKYFEHHRGLAGSRPLAELAPEQILTQFTVESQQSSLLKGGDVAAFEQDIRGRLDAYYLENFHRVQAETTKRWTFEAEVKRPYFHVTDLPEADLSNWTKYLDFEESQGDPARISFLYERCLVATAHYDEYWLRYVRWMYTQPGSIEEVRAIYARASYIFAPIAKPAIRKQWALFEESQGRPSVAAAIYEAILLVMPDHEDAILRLANLQHRQEGLDAALAVYDAYIAADQTPRSLAGALVGHAALLLYRSGPEKDNVGRAQAYFEKHASVLADSEPYWRSLLEFEAALPTPSPEAHIKLLTRVKALHALIRDPVGGARLPPDSVADLSRLYMRFLAERGGTDAAAEWLELDTLVDGSAAAAHAIRQRGGALAGIGSGAMQVVAGAATGINGH